jgi:aspartate aminotransferase
MIEFTGAKPVPVPILQANNFSFNAQQTLSLINQNTRLIIINSPANPSGGVAPRSEIEALVKGLESHPHVAILSDEIYDTLIYDGESHVSLLEFPSIRNQLIVLNGWSKTWAMTGWRLGWSIWPDQLLGDIRKFALNGWSCVNAPAQFGGIAAIDGSQDDVEIMLKAFDRRRGIIVERLNKLPGFKCSTPTGAFYAFPDITQTGWKAKEFATQLLEESGVAIVGGPDFGTLGEGYVRLSYANSIENIECAIDRIAQFLNR